MKNFVKLSLILTTLVLIVSCSKKPSEMIVGKWTIQDVKASSELSDEQKDAFNDLIEEIKAVSFLELKSDKSFAKKLGENASEGTWELSEDGKKLTLSYDKIKEVSRINELTENVLSLSITLDDGETTIIYGK